MNNELLVKAQRQLKENTNTSGPETVKANSPREITILFVSETFFGPQNSALVLDEGACTQFGVASLICDFSYSKEPNTNWQLSYQCKFNSPNTKIAK